MRNFKYALYVGIVLSVFLHKELFSFYRWDVLPIRAFMVGILIVGSFFLLKNIKTILQPATFKQYLTDPFLVSLILLWVVRGASLVFSWNITASILLYGFFTASVFLVFFMYIFLRNNQIDTLGYIKFFVIIVFGLTIFGYFQIGLYLTTGKIIGALWNIPGNIPRVGTTFWDVNHFASLLAAFIPIAGVLFLTDKKIKHKVFYFLVVVSLGVTLFLTNSRTSWILLAIAALFFVIGLLVKWKGFKGILLLVLFFIVIAVPMVNEYNIKSSPFRARIKQYFHYRMDSFDSHFMLLTGAFQIFEQYPVLGGGYGSFFEHFSKTKIAPTFFGRDPAALNTRVPAHTIWGELLSETGVLGLTAFVLLCMSLIGLLIYNFSNNETKQEKLLNLSMASVIIGWLVAGIFYSYNSEFFWLTWGLFYLYGLNSLGRGKSFAEVLSFYTKSVATYVIGILVIAAFLIFVNLGTNHLIPWDEAIYAKIAKNMVVDNNYVVQTWQSGKVWYEKPPLYMWVMSGLMNGLGFNSWAARLPSAIFGLLTVLVTFVFANKLFGKTVGFISAFVLVTTTQFLYYSRAAMLDVTATFFITSALYFYYTSVYNLSVKLPALAGSYEQYRNREARITANWLRELPVVDKESLKRLFISGLLIGFAVMVKGVIGIVPMLILFGFELVRLLVKDGEKSTNRLYRPIVLLAGLLIVALPWHLEMYRRFGSPFLSNYIGYHVWDRATSAIEDKGRPFFWYITVIKVSMRTWFVVLIPALVYLISRVVKKEKPLIFLGIWLTVIFLIFSWAKSKLVWYIIPIYPVLAIVVGLFIKKAFDFVFNRLKLKNYSIVKFVFSFGLVVCGLFYLYMVKYLVYTSDLTGPEARLIQAKDAKFEKADVLYADRIELPLLLFYTDGLFKVVDFRPDVKDRVPSVSYSEPLVLLTKKGRFSETVVGKNYAPVVLAEDGDYILWYFQSGLEKDSDALAEMRKRSDEINLNPLFQAEFDKLQIDIVK